jgi:hypothetical protein
VAPEAGSISISTASSSFVATRRTNLFVDEATWMPGWTRACDAMVCEGPVTRQAAACVPPTGELGAAAARSASAVEQPITSANVNGKVTSFVFMGIFS